MDFKIYLLEYQLWLEYHVNAKTMTNNFFKDKEMKGNHRVLKVNKQ